MKLELEKFTRRDLDWLIGIFDSPRALLLWAGQAFEYPLDRSQLKKHLALTRLTYPRYRYYKALLDYEPAMNSRPGKKVRVGYIELSRINRNRSAFITRVLVHPDFRRQGIAQSMVRRILQIGFEDFKLHRIELNVYDCNQAAIACYERAGFQKEGLLRDVALIGRQYWSEYRMAILEHEFRTRNS